MIETKQTYYAGSEPFDVVFPKHKYMVIMTTASGKQRAEFYDDAEELAYIGLSMWDDIEDLDYYVLDESGKYVPEMKEGDEKHE